ncbi:6-phosphofructokinase [Pelagicoccus sp. NFK12]|uniref:Pyrophosphate--fructose 6-phosphate 1-phosphotransferase n=1 Tax=Pelagicoccus enzymogenes TaxID=2773457 RepID=A0A927FD47_9BACT|nr:6-phosphofructokinase [Pelagicoccus enzymogenes]MBD5781490.1 6-phosphofructokinase [Pelagicoccus enzymogenes]
MSELEGNCLVCQSGGPTAVINASLAGVIEEALNHECIEEIYGGLNGVVGVLNEDLVDLAAESQQAIRLLKSSPGSALGTCRYVFKKEEDLERALEVFKAHNIRYFFYIGDSESMAMLDKLDALAKEQGYEMRVIGIPKTINNDISATDHTPGYGSMIKHVATTVREMAADNESIGEGDYVSILEVQGRNSGWIAAGSTLAKRRDQPHDPPHIILLPEIAFDPEKFVADVQKVLAREKYCLIVVGEGLVDLNGNYVSAKASSTDAFGHVQLGGAGEFLRGIVETRIGVSARSCKLGVAGRAATHNASQADSDEAYLAGSAAVVQAVENGKSGKMITLQRAEADSYKCETGWVDLADVPATSKQLPAEWINDDGVSMNFPFVKYATPLIQGEVNLQWENGLPVFVNLKATRIDKVLPAYEI